MDLVAVDVREREIEVGLAGSGDDGLRARGRSFLNKGVYLRKYEEKAEQDESYAARDLDLWEPGAKGAQLGQEHVRGQRDDDEGDGQAGRVDQKEGASRQSASRLRGERDDRGQDGPHAGRPRKRKHEAKHEGAGEASGIEALGKLYAGLPLKGRDVQRAGIKQAKHNNYQATCYREVCIIDKRAQRARAKAQREEGNGKPRHEGERARKLARGARCRRVRVGREQRHIHRQHRQDAGREEREQPCPKYRCDVSQLHGGLSVLRLREFASLLASWIVIDNAPWRARLPCQCLINVTT